MAAAPKPVTHELVHRTCPLCEAKCGISVEVDRSVQDVVTIKGDRLDPFSGGYLCPKAYGLKGLHEDPDRLRRPIRRDGTSWREVGWDEAFDYVTSRLQAVRSTHGADAIGTYLGNPNAHDGFAGLYTPGFQRALGTRWRFSATSVDQLPKALSSSLMFGSAAYLPVPDLDRTQFLLVLGANPLASNGSLMTAPDMPGRLEALRKRGGTLVVVDPRRSETARIADGHLAIRPGTDAFFLFSLVHVLFEEGLVRMGRLEAMSNGVAALRELASELTPERTAATTGIAADEVRRLARAFAAAERAVCYGRIGTCTQEFGTLASWLVDAVNVLTGNADRPGGVMWARSPAGPAKDRPGRRAAQPYARWHSRVRGLPEFGGELPVATLAEEIDSAGEQRIRALVTIAGNPMLSTPNGTRLGKALASLDFMVSVDLYLNETTRFAEVILPPTGHLERGNFDFFFHALMVRQSVKWTPPVFEKPAGALHQWEILRELTARLSGITVAGVEEAMLQQALGGSVGPGTACPDVTPEEARRKLGDVGGPERLIDLRLRAGPWGDRFDDGASDALGPKLSLARLRAAEHGIDLGPLEPRLPDMLATESGKIELAPPLLVEDVARLRAALDGRGAPEALLLVGRRHLRSNNSWMHNVEALAKGPERCTLLVNPEDATRLGLAHGGRARVRSRVGEVTAPVAVTDEVRPGVVSLPHGFGHDATGARLRVASRHAGVNSNLLADEMRLDAVSGNAVLNGIPVEVSAA